MLSSLANGGCRKFNIALARWINPFRKLFAELVAARIRLPPLQVSTLAFAT
jgi:hypothetical protein